MERQVTDTICPSTVSDRLRTGGSTSASTGISAGAKWGRPMLTRTQPSRPASPESSAVSTPAPVSTRMGPS
jgi:hypothetical protein